MSCCNCQKAYENFEVNRTLFVLLQISLNRLSSKQFLNRFDKSEYKLELNDRSKRFKNLKGLRIFSPDLYQNTRKTTRPKSAEPNGSLEAIKGKARCKSNNAYIYIQCDFCQFLLKIIYLS